jgi:SAM-dependent methyltransferase
MTAPEIFRDLQAAAAETLSRCFSTELEETYAHIDRLCSHFCFGILHEFRIFEGGDRLSFGDAATRVGAVKESQYLLRAILDILREDGFLIEEDGAWRACRSCPPDDSAALHRQAKEQFPRAAAILELLERCRQGAPAYLTGRQSGMSVVFPRGDTSLWERVHREDSVMSIYADPIAPALEAVLQRPGQRVLEVGAGVGAVLRRCLPLLRERRIGEYRVTDLGKVFVQRLERENSQDAFVRGAVLDLDLPLADQLADQGVEPGSFDAILGVNVLHSVKNLEFTLMQLRGALAEHGCLLLGEGSPPQPGRRWRLDLVFAFLSGWWDVPIDPLKRPREGFLFPHEWIDLLRSCGYGNALALPGEDWFRGACRGGLIAASDSAQAQGLLHKAREGVCACGQAAGLEEGRSGPVPLSRNGTTEPDSAAREALICNCGAGVFACGQAAGLEEGRSGPVPL